MQEIKRYRCDCCGTEYANRENAKACEKNHKRPTLFVAARYISKGQNDSGYPVTITVRMSDGTLQTYKR